MKLNQLTTTINNLIGLKFWKSTLGQEDAFILSLELEQALIHPNIVVVQVMSDVRSKD